MVRYRYASAVVPSYAAYLALVWFHPRWAVNCLSFCFAWFAQNIDFLFKDTLNTVARRIVVGGMAPLYL